MEPEKILLNSFLLKGLGDAERAHALALLSPSTERYEKGEVIASAGDTVTDLRFLALGSAEVFRDPERRVLLNRLGVGDCFGAANLFCEASTYPTEIVAKSAVTCVSVSESRLTELFREIPTSALNYISFLSDRIRFLNRRVGDFSCGSAEKKVARLLLEASDSDGNVALGNLRAAAESMNLGRASLYRVLTSFTERELIVKDGKQIKILLKEELKGILS